MTLYLSHARSMHMISYHGKIICHYFLKLSNLILWALKAVCAPWIGIFLGIFGKPECTASQSSTLRSLECSEEPTAHSPAKKSCLWKSVWEQSRPLKVPGAWVTFSQQLGYLCRCNNLSLRVTRAVDLDLSGFYDNCRDYFEITHLQMHPGLLRYLILISNCHSK